MLLFIHTFLILLYLQLMLILHLHQHGFGRLQMTKTVKKSFKFGPAAQPKIEQKVCPVSVCGI